MNDVFGKKLGQYVLLEQLGEGGMAKVYNALDTRVDSNVAIKVILPSKRSSQVFLQQFEQEAKALANLTHTNIVKVLNYGVQGDQPYLVMEYIPGGTLKEAMSQKLPWQIAAATLAPIARALDYVHQQQIVHRDVKPSNILLQEDFNPMLSDFGILKLLENKDEKVDSAIGSGVGTPEYMPPEQGMGKDVDFRADIYSLGIVFYEMVTGQKAFTADTPMAVVIKHITDEIKLPTSIDRNIPKFVELAILRAVQKNPEDRYLNMGHFADVLELIALGDNTHTKEVTRISRQKATDTKKTFPVAFMSVVLLIVTSVSFFAYYYFNASRTARPETLPSTSDIVVENTATPQPAETRQADTSVSTSLPVEGPAVKPDVNQLSGISLLGTPFPKNRGSDFEEIARWGIGGVNVAAWSPDGTEIALGTTNGIFIYDEDRNLILFVDLQFNVVAMAYSPVANEITAGSPDGNVVTINAETGVVLQDHVYSVPVSKRIDIPPSGAVTAISYSPNGKNFAVGYANGVINYFSVVQGSPIAAFDEPPSIKDLVISGDGSLIYASTGTRSVAIWNIPTREETKSLEAPSTITKLSISRQGGQFLLGGSENGGSAYLWDLDPLKLRLVKSFTNSGGQVTDFDFSSDNKYIAVGLNNGTVRTFEMPAPDDYSKASPPIATTTSMGGQIRTVAFSPNQPVLAAGNWEGGASLWNAQTGENIDSLAEGIGGVNEIYLSNDGSWLATSHSDGFVRIWDVNSAQEYHKLPGYLPMGAPFSTDNRYLAMVNKPGRNLPDSIQVVDLKKREIVAEMPDIASKSFVQFTDDNHLLIAGTPYTARIWDVSTWEQVVINPNSGFNAGCGQYRIPPPYPIEDNLLALISSSGILFSYDDNIQKMCGFNKPGMTPMYFFQEQNQIFFVLGDGDIWIGNGDADDIASKTSSAPYPVPGNIFLAGDRESGWYAYVFGEKLENLRISQLDNSSNTTIGGQDDYAYRVAFLPGKKLIALGSKYGSIHFLTMP